MATKTQFDFQPPNNLTAIRCTIMHRIQQQQKKKMSQLDSGLPSPPVESCPYDAPLPAKEQNQQALATPVSECPPTIPTVMSEEKIKEKIKMLQDEKHRLFITMKGLLSQQTKSETSQVDSTSASSTPLERPVCFEPTPVLQPLPQSREDLNDDSSSTSTNNSSNYSSTTQKSERSQSISYSDRRKMSRHEYRRPPPTYYDDRYYGTRYPYPVPPSSSPSYAMSRRTSLSPYPSSRHPLQPRNSSFRPRSQADRHLPRY